MSFNMKVVFEKKEFTIEKDTRLHFERFLKHLLMDIRASGNFDNDCWTWALATFGDFMHADAIDIIYGGNEDAPEGIKNNQIFVMLK